METKQAGEPLRTCRFVAYHHLSGCAAAVEFYTERAHEQPVNTIM